jgi:hypothetical protein
MHDLFRHLSIVLLPLILTSTIHMILVKYKILELLNKPIWNYGFGTNKTLRGLLLVPIINALIVGIISCFVEISFISPFLLGYLLGIAYLLAELPNSFLKRRLGIGSGISGTRYKYLFYVLDKTDSSFGVTLSYSLLAGLNFNMGIKLFLANSIMHTVVAFILIKLKIKKGF